MPPRSSTLASPNLHRLRLPQRRRMPRSSRRIIRPFAHRSPTWGGWYVNATRGQQRRPPNAVAGLPLPTAALRTNLAHALNPSGLSHADHRARRPDDLRAQHSRALFTRLQWKSRMGRISMPIIACHRRLHDLRGRRSPAPRAPSKASPPSQNLPQARPSPATSISTPASSATPSYMIYTRCVRFPPRRRPPAKNSGVSLRQNRPRRPSHHRPNPPR